VERKINKGCWAGLCGWKGGERREVLGWAKRRDAGGKEMHLNAFAFKFEI
jgi:hypothetical protein